MKLNIPLIIFLTLFGFSLKSQTRPNYGEQSVIHVKKLCEFGERKFGSEAESLTLNYLKNEFESAGLEVKIDTFEFQKFNLNARSFKINDKTIQLKSVYINEPSQNNMYFEGCCIKLNNFKKHKSLKNKVIITSLPENCIKLCKQNPKAIFVIEPELYDSIQIDENSKYRIELNGQVQSAWLKSYNIVATYNYDFPSDSNIIITAHWDSQNGIGAGDNASGTSLLIELAKHYKDELGSIKHRLVFIATGAEEFGFIGSTSYILNNYQQVDKCIFNLNIDNVSNEIPTVELCNIKYDNNEVDLSQTVALYKHYSSNGFLLSTPDEFSNYHTLNLKIADELKSSIENQIGHTLSEIRFTDFYSGTDSRVFDFMKIPYARLGSICINNKGNKANTSSDIYNNSFIHNIQKGGFLADLIIMNRNK